MKSVATKKTSKKTTIKKSGSAAKPRETEKLSAEFWEKEYYRIKAELQCMYREVAYLRDEVQQYKRPLLAMLAKENPVTDEMLAEAEAIAMNPDPKKPSILDILDDLNGKPRRPRR